MKFHVISVSRRLPAWTETGVGEYLKRMGAACPVVVREVPQVKRVRGVSVQACLEKEGRAVLAAAPRGSHVVALDRQGGQWTTRELASRMQRWLNGGRDVAFLVGGSDGLSDECKARADESWSFSKLTFPHSLARLMLIEQLYRGWSLLSGSSYHRE